MYFHVHILNFLKVSDTTIKCYQGMHYWLSSLERSERRAAIEALREHTILSFTSPGVSESSPSPAPRSCSNDIIFLLDSSIKCTGRDKCFIKLPCPEPRQIQISTPH